MECVVLVMGCDDILGIDIVIAYLYEDNWVVIFLIINMIKFCYFLYF